ncbi:MAG: type II secretion system F family protein [Lachnospiraceae bacterium]|nr:type II secretion system F family protein [Lachnospiraceae bacterium]
MNTKERVTAAIKAILMITGIALLCYDSIFAALLLSPYIFLYMKRKTEQLKEDRKWELNLQFGEMIKSLSAVLESGYSVENAVTEAFNDLKLTHDENSMIMKELKIIISSLKSNVPIEAAFEEFAERSGIEDIRSFSDVFSTAKRTGGNIISIIRSTAAVIRTRTELKRELKTMIASKKYESDIMRLIPFAILLYLRVFSPDMVGALYGNMFGIIFMTVILAVYVVLGMTADRIIRIDY